MGTVTVDGSKIDLSAREYELLVYLALRDGPVSSESISESLRPRSDADRARSALKVTLSRLRSRLGDASLIVAAPMGYVLKGERHIDIESVLKRDRSASLVDIPNQMQLEAARERQSRWDWAETLATRCAEFETPTEAGHASS